MAILMPLGGDDEGEEEKKAADDQGGIMGIENSPNDREKMSDGYEWRDGWFGTFRRIVARSHREQFFAKCREEQGIRHEDTHDSFPPEVHEHVADPPIPFSCHHHDRWRGEVGERAADGDVHEEEPEGRIAQVHAWLELVESVHQQQGADGHRGGLGDERSEEGSHGEDREPPGEGSLSPKGRKERQAALGKAKDGLRARDGHDYENEDRLGVFHAIEIMDHCFPALERDDGDRQRNRPNSEHRFDLAKEMEEGGLEAQPVALAGNTGCFARVCLVLFEDVILMLVPVRDRKKSSKP